LYGTWGCRAACRVRLARRRFEQVLSAAEGLASEQTKGLLCWAPTSRAEQKVLVVDRFCFSTIGTLLVPGLPCYNRLAVAKSSFSTTFTTFTSLVTLQLTRFVCRDSEEQFLMSSRDTRSAAGSAGDSAAEPAASRSPTSVPPPTLLGEAPPTSQKRKASQLSTSSVMPSDSLMAPPPRRSKRKQNQDPAPVSLPSSRRRGRQAKQLTAISTSE
jgi:hypothetical protein